MKRTSCLVLCGLGAVILGGALRAPPSRAAATLAGGRLAGQPTRILYASDWEGPTQIFAVDPTGRRPLGQVTLGRAPACIDSLPFACGFTDPVASPNGESIAYSDEAIAGTAGQHFWVADASGRAAHEVATPPHWYDQTTPYNFFQEASVTSPNGRWTAIVDAKGISVTDRRGRRRHLTSDTTFALSWAPNSKSIAYIQGGIRDDEASTGDLKVVSLTGRSRTLVRADGPYGGQIVALTWTRVPKGIAYRRPLVASSPSVFVGGPVGRLAAGGSRVAVAACGRLSVWVPPNTVASTFAQLGAGGVCFSPDARGQYYDLAVGSDRVYWGEKTYGLSYGWSLHARTLSSGTSFTLANGFSGLGCPECDGAGALVASGDLMVFGQWQTVFQPPPAVTTETLFRGTAAGCPCTAIAYGAAPRSIAPLVPLDTDGTRIAVLRYGSTIVIDSNGNDLLTTGVAAAGAQIMGNNLLVLTDGRLTEYDIESGAGQHSWPLPGGTPGRDCSFYSEPHCPENPSVTLQDAARGLVALTVNGQLRILHLNNGADNTVGYATEARFMDTGLVFADGARVTLIPYSQLGA